LIIPVVITVYQDRSYTFITKTPPAAILLKRAAGIAKGSAEPNKTKVAKVTMKQVEEIAKTKMPDLNARSGGRPRRSSWAPPGIDWKFGNGPEHGVWNGREGIEEYVGKEVSRSQGQVKPRVPAGRGGRADAVLSSSRSSMRPPKSP
jgi:hypothetical protein